MSGYFPISNAPASDPTPDDTVAPAVPTAPARWWPLRRSGKMGVGHARWQTQGQDEVLKEAGAAGRALRLQTPHYRLATVEVILVAYSRSAPRRDPASRDTFARYVRAVRESVKLRDPLKCALREAGRAAQEGELHVA